MIIRPDPESVEPEQTQTVYTVSLMKQRLQSVLVEKGRQSDLGSGGVLGFGALDGGGVLRGHGCPLLSQNINYPPANKEVSPAEREEPDLLTGVHGNRGGRMLSSERSSSL